MFKRQKLIIFAIFGIFHTIWQFANCVEVQPKCFQSVVVVRDDCTKLTLNSGVFPKIDLPEPFFGTKCCYNDSIGCFDNVNGSVWECFPALPECMAEIKPQFMVFTPESAPQSQEVDFFDLRNSIQKLNMSSSRDFVVVVHGIGSEWPKWWCRPIVDAFLKLNCNVLFVRWSNGSNISNGLSSLFKTVANARSVSLATSRVLSAILTSKKADLDLTTIVGYSLGAHIAGMIGSMTPNLPRIIALDPAGPMFSCQDRLVRLDPTDANFVMVLHTNADSFFYSGLGSPQAMGHVDVYANNAAVQPGCKRGNLKLIADLVGAPDGKTSSDEDSDIWCSHTRSMKYFLEMLEYETCESSCAYYGFPCSSLDNWLAGACFPCPKVGCPVLGYNFMKNNTMLRGKLFFNTMPDTSYGCRFCAAHHLITLTPNINVTGKIILVLIASKDIIQQLVFQGENDTLIANSDNKKLVTSWFKITSVLTMQIKYTAPVVDRDSLTTKSAWKLIGCSATNMRGIKHQCSETVEISSDKPIEVSLQ